MKKERKKSTLSLLKTFLPYYKKYKWILVSDLLCASLTTVCELILPLLVREITGAASTDPITLTVSLILKCTLLYVVLRIIDTAANYYMASVGHIMGTRMETDMRHDFFAHLQKLSFSYYDNAKVGTLMSRITSDLFDVTEFAHHCPEEFFIAGIKIICSFIILCTINVPLTLIIFSVIPPMVIILRIFNRRMKEGFKESRKQVGELNSQIEDSLLGIRVVKSFANEAVEQEKFDRGNHKFLDIKRKVYHIMAGFQSSTRLFDGIMYIVVVAVGGLFMLGGEGSKLGSITPADYIAYLMFVTTLLTSVRRIVEFTEQFQRGMTGIERFSEIMDIEPDITDKKNADVLENVRGEVRFSDVSFSYETGDKTVLAHINLDVKAGESIALVGPSGGGKTTLCSLIPRFYDTTDGEIMIDGKNIKEVTLASLRNNIGVVAQDVYLFSGSIRENIAYGKKDATDDEIIEAAKLAGADDFITRLPKGYETELTNNGSNLSQGQRQLLAIARAAVADPPVMILDEATSSIDTRTEAIVQKGMDALMKGRTVFVIAHRLSTVRNSDVIMVLDHGRIIERGDHQRLIEQKGQYYQLYTGAFELE